MRNRLIVTLASAVVLAATLTPGVVEAAPNAGFVADGAPTVGQPTTFTVDAQTNCAVNRCQWDWEYIGAGGVYKIGGQLGEGSRVVWVPSVAAAAKSYVVVKLKVTAAGGTNGYGIAAHAYVVTP